jgi:hypothetical protein
MRKNLWMIMFFDKIHKGNIITTYIKLAAWIVFLACFGPLCLINGLYGGALFISLLGIFLTYFIFKRAVLNFPVESQHRLARLFFIEHTAIALAALYLIFFAPMDGNWTRMAGTENWSDPALVHIDTGRYAVLCTEGEHRKVFYTEDSGESWKDCSYPGGSGREIAHHSAGNDIWIIPKDENLIHRYSLSKKKWESIVRIPRAGKKLFPFKGAGLPRYQKQPLYISPEREQLEAFHFL